MTVYFPAYYNKFKCIADKCSHSCCIGWEIGLDDQTMHRYREMSGAIGEDIRLHLDAVESVIIMEESGRCPFLDLNGLCKIISSIGEENTSRICREHPRFYHQIADRIEGGIGASCEEACRIILTSDNFSEFVETHRNVEPSCSTDFDTISHREYLFSLLSDKEISYHKATELIREKYDIPKLKEMNFDEAFACLEYLDEDHAGIFKVRGLDERESSGGFMRRFLAYLIFRHVSVAENYEDLRSRIAFCLLLSCVFENFLSKSDSKLDVAIDFARIISEEIEYSEDNTSSLIMEMWSLI